MGILIRFRAENVCGMYPFLSRAQKLDHTPSSREPNDWSVPARCT